MEGAWGSGVKGGRAVNTGRSEERRGSHRGQMVKSDLKKPQKQRKVA